MSSLGGRTLFANQLCKDLYYNRLLMSHMPGRSLFISYASEDRDKVAAPLAAALKEKGWLVWYDNYVLKMGDNLRREIDKGLSACDFGIVVLSTNFFSKEWPQRELDALVARESSVRRKVILPVWHEISRDDVLRFSPLMADRLGVPTSKGIPYVVEQVVAAINEFFKSTLEPTHDQRAASLLHSFPADVLLLGIEAHNETFSNPIRMWGHHKVAELPGLFWAMADFEFRTSHARSKEEFQAELVRIPASPPKDLVVLDFASLQRFGRDSTIAQMPRPRVALILEEKREFIAEMVRKLFLSGADGEQIRDWMNEHRTDA